MKLGSIKTHLRDYKIVDRRRTTISHAFASALAPVDLYDEEKIRTAVSENLGQDPDGELSCVYCDARAETWDHVVGLVKKGVLRGFGHQIGNLVPCCKACNSSKGGKTVAEHLEKLGQSSKAKNIRLRRICNYTKNYAVKIDLDAIKSKRPNEWRQFEDLRAQIVELMEQADVLALELRTVHVKT
jgi:5-methylcytosine-specific restriction endonuclease McrA